MEWTENEEQTNDRCSTASSISNSGEVNPIQTSNGSKKTQSANGSHNTIEW